jgi:heme-degrading monooxygenase HmoA
MSVIVIGHFPVADIARAKQSLASNAALLAEITEETKQLGAIHHRFLEGDGELLVIDEWESAEAFNGFFSSNTKVPQVTQDAGVSGPPKIEFYSPLEAAGTF